MAYAGRIDDFNYSFMWYETEVSQNTMIVFFFFLEFAVVFLPPHDRAIFYFVFIFLNNIGAVSE